MKDTDLEGLISSVEADVALIRRVAVALDDKIDRLSALTDDKGDIAEGDVSRFKDAVRGLLAELQPVVARNFD